MRRCGAASAARNARAALPVLLQMLEEGHCPRVAPMAERLVSSARRPGPSLRDDVSDTASRRRERPTRAGLRSSGRVGVERAGVRHFAAARPSPRLGGGVVNAAAALTCPSVQGSGACSGVADDFRLSAQALDAPPERQELGRKGHHSFLQAESPVFCVARAEKGRASPLAASR